MRAALRVLLAAAPASALAAVGLLHPIFLTPETADRWQFAHLLLLPLFPLLAAPFWGLVRGDRGLFGWSVRVLASGYAVLYGALDSIAGIGAPEQIRAAVQRGSPRPPIEDLFAIGDRLGHLGVWALAAAAALAAASVFRRTGIPVAPLGGALVAACCLPFYRYHVFPPRGVLAMVGMAVGWP